MILLSIFQMLMSLLKSQLNMVPEDSLLKDSVEFFVPSQMSKRDSMLSSIVLSVWKLRFRSLWKSVINNNFIRMHIWLTKDKHSWSIKDTCLKLSPVRFSKRWDISEVATEDSLWELPKNKRSISKTFFEVLVVTDKQRIIKN